MLKKGKKDLKQILLEGNFVTVEDIQKAEEYAEHNNVKMEQYLIDEGLMSKNLLGEAIAESMGVAFADLKATAIGSEEVNRIPEEVGRSFTVVTMKEEKKHVEVATDDPENQELHKELKQIFRGTSTDQIRSQFSDRGLFCVLQEAIGHTFCQDPRKRRTCRS